MSNIKNELEKNFFNIKFEDIKKYSEFENLNLSDDEIIKHREKIKKVLRSNQLCGENFKFCKNIHKHYSLKRNEDNIPILTEKKCKKTKNFYEISEKNLNEQINKFLYGISSKFNFSEVKMAISNLNLKNNEAINSPEETNKFVYINNIDQLRYVAILNAFHLILKSKTVAILKTNELKDICVNNHFNFKKEDSRIYSQRYRFILSVDALIILNLGLESDSFKQNYYLDLLTTILETRKMKKKITQIFSPLTWETIKTEINSSAKNKSHSITVKYKIEELNNIMSYFLCDRFQKDTQI